MEPCACFMQFMQRTSAVVLPEDLKDLANPWHTEGGDRIR